MSYNTSNNKNISTGCSEGKISAENEFNVKGKFNSRLKAFHNIFIWVPKLTFMGSSGGLYDIVLSHVYSSAGDFGENVFQVTSATFTRRCICVLGRSFSCLFNFILDFPFISQTFSWSCKLFCSPYTRFLVWIHFITNTVLHTFKFLSVCLDFSRNNPGLVKTRTCSSDLHRGDWPLWCHQY